MKNVIYILPLLAAVSGVSQAAQIYKSEDHQLELGGRLEGRLNWSDKNKQQPGDSTAEGKSRARVNLEAQSKISSGLTAFGRLEVELSDSDEVTELRYMYTGIDTNYGAMTFGKNDTSLVELSDMTDILYTFGGNAAEPINAVGELQSDTLGYEYQGKRFALQLNASPTMRDSANNEELGYAAALLYSLTDTIELGVGYGASGDDNQVTASSAWQAENVYISALVLSGVQAESIFGLNDNYLGFEVASSVELGKFTLAATYNYLDYDIDGAVVDEIALEAAYSLMPTFNLYGGYLLNQAKGGEDEIQVGIRYDF